MNDNFSTNDLNLASTLVVLGYTLIDLDRSNPKRVRFLFSREKDIEEKISQYWSDSITVPAQRLLNTHKQLKSRIYADEL